MSIVACEGFAGCVDCVGCVWLRVGDAGRAVVCLLGIAVVEAAFCSVVVVAVGAEKGFGAAYFESSFDTFVWLGFFWCWVVAGRVVLGLEDSSRADNWRVIWPTEVMMGFAVSDKCARC